MTHPGHQFARIGPLVGGELIASVPQIVEVNDGQPGRVEGG